jgi:hypothetical protein
MSATFQVGECVEVVEHHLDSEIVLKIGGIYQIVDRYLEREREQQYVVRYQKGNGSWGQWWVSEKCLAPLSLENE